MLDPTMTLLVLLSFAVAVIFLIIHIVLERRKREKLTKDTIRKLEEAADTLRTGVAILEELDASLQQEIEVSEARIKALREREKTFHERHSREQDEP